MQNLNYSSSVFLYFFHAKLYKKKKIISQLQTYIKTYIKIKYISRA